MSEERRIEYTTVISRNIEPIYRQGVVSWCVYVPREDDVHYYQELPVGDVVYRPHPVLRLYAEKGFLFLPERPEEYGNTMKLADEIYDFLYRHVDYEDTYRRLDVWYAFFTWVYDQFPIVPYRRALGDWGRGKSRWAKTLGSICYRAFIQGAATSAAPVFRLSDAIRGTQIIDENYFSLNHLA